MGIMSYSGMSPFRIGSSVIRTITLKNSDGSVVGTIGVSGSARSRSANQKKRKKVQYSFKQLSTFIMRTKKAVNAGQAVSRARQKVAGLQRMLYTGEYDDNEIKLAIRHAEAMVRVAKKRKKHLQEEEQAGKHGGVCQAELEEEQTDGQEEYFMEEYPEDNAAEISEEEMRQLMQELQQEMQDMMEDSMESSMEDLEQEIMSGDMTVNRTNMDPEDLESLKKKHRAEELREILEADMKYLKALFNKYQQDKKNAGNSQGSQGSRSAGDSQGSSGAVSLELGGAEVPVDTGGEIPVVTEGANMDTLV